MEHLKSYKTEKATNKPQSQTEVISMIVRKVLMAEREGFEPSVQVLARTTV